MFCFQSKMPDRPSSLPDPPPPKWDPIDDSLLEEIYNADQAIYPAPLLTYQRMRSWAVTCPDLCVCLHQHNGPDLNHDQAVDGVVIVLPVVEESWGRLVAGELREHDVDPGRMFPPAGAPGAANGHSEVAKVGLHVFHIERYSPSAGGRGRTPLFTQTALEEVRSRVDKKFPSWKVVGYSGM